MPSKWLASTWPGASACRWWWCSWQSPRRRTYPTHISRYTWPPLARTQQPHVSSSPLLALSMTTTISMGNGNGRVKLAQAAGSFKQSAQHAAPPQPLTPATRYPTMRWHPVEVGMALGLHASSQPDPLVTALTMKPRPRQTGVGVQAYKRMWPNQAVVFSWSRRVLEQEKAAPNNLPNNAQGPVARNGLVIHEPILSCPLRQEQQQVCFPVCPLIWPAHPLCCSARA